MALFLVALGLVPLVLASAFVGRVGGPAGPGESQQLQLPWSFVLEPGWSPAQLGFIVMAGAVLGVTSIRPAFGLVAVVLGILLGLAIDLWWLSGFVRPEDQSFVSLLPQVEWRSRVIGSSLALGGVAAIGFAVGAVGRLLTRDRSTRQLVRPSAAGLTAVGVAAVGGPLLAVGIAWAAASSVLVVPEGSQVQAVDFTGATITIDPVVLRQGETRFRCSYAPGAEPWAGLLVAIPQGADVATLPPAQDFIAACGPSGAYQYVGWGTVAHLTTGRYVWQQVDNSVEVLRVTATSPIVIVSP